MKDRRASPLKVQAFRGMNNIAVKSKSSLELPSMILNANVDLDGSLQKRPGLEKVLDLPGAHSLWTNNAGVVLCMTQGVLYRIIDTSSTVQLVDTGQPDSPVSYTEISGNIYISNENWTGMYDPSQDAMKTWGEPVPDTPVIVPVAGSLPPGNYMVGITVLSEYGRTSGNSRLMGIILDEPGGISILNLPINASVWITDPNEGILLFAGNSSIITDVSENSEPIPTMWGGAPPPMKYLCWAFGRVWGSVGNRIYYSEPYQPELFNLNDSFFDLKSPVGLIAKAVRGLYVGCKNETNYFAGTDPNQMIQTSIGPGVVPGSLSYVSELGDMGRNIPVWIGKNGVYAGLEEGKTINMIKDRVQINPQQVAGASICRVKDGRKQMLFSAKQKASGQEIGFGDNACCEIIRKGSVI